MSNPNVVIITGASAGIGHAITRTSLNQDAYVVLVDIDEGPLQSFLDDYGEEKVRYIVGDVSQDSTNAAAVAKASQSWGRIDGVVSNAGVLTPVHRLEGVDAAEWARGFGVNVIGQVSMLSAAIAHSRKTKGRVIFTSSDAGDRIRFPSWGAYGATKAAVNYVIRTSTLEEHNITAVGIYPGVVDTPLVQAIFDGEYADGMPKEEVETYVSWAKANLVRPEQPGSVIGRLALIAPPESRGEIMYWNDKRSKALANI